jgi:hypothetical protein
MLSISYDRHSLQDGAGAQLQRIIGIYAIARFFRIGYIHNPLDEILVHPGDDVYDDESYSEFKSEINSLIPFPSSHTLSRIDKKVKIRNLGVKEFIKYWLRYRFSKKHLHIEILHPYHVLDRFPFVMESFRKSNLFSVPQQHKRISLHVRQSGTDNSFVLEGEKQTRNLPLSYYVKSLEYLENLYGREYIQSCEMLIVTDEPESNLEFVPFKGQAQLWSAVGYPIDTNGIRFENGNLVKEIVARFPQATILRGGRPAKSIELLAGSEFLVMSRSSFSVVAKLLSASSKVISPPSFNS